MQAKTLLKAEHLLQYFILYLTLLIVESFLGGRCFVNHKKKFYTYINKTWWRKVGHSSSMAFSNILKIFLCSDLLIQLFLIS